jgi:hypothetical protein
MIIFVAMKNMKLVKAAIMVISQDVLTVLLIHFIIVEVTQVAFHVHVILIYLPTIQQRFNVI